MKRYRIWFILLAAWLLVACSKESEQTENPTPPPTPVTPTTPPEEQPPTEEPEDTTQKPPIVQVDGPMWLVSTTRAGVYDANEDYSPIQIFVTSGATETELKSMREGQFLYDAGWYSTIGLKESDPYVSIYGFSPADAASCTISPLSGTSYHTGAVLEMKNVNAASGEDLCVIVGVKYSEEASTALGIPERGKFGFKKGTDNYISLLLDHVFARLDFKVKIGEDYSKRRHVRIKKLELQSAYKLTGMTIKLTSGSNVFAVDYNIQSVTNDADKPMGIVYDFSADTDPNNQEGKPLTTEGTVFPGFFAPDTGAKVGPGLSLICTYDVYSIDINNKVGERVRENCVAVNSLKNVFTSLEAPLKRGQKTTLTLTVEPTYLYQLSDDELDNPGISMKVEH